MARTSDHINNITKWELDDRVKAKSRCFGKFSEIKHLVCSPTPLISAILNSFKENAFIFNGHRLYFGLEDVFYLTGLPIDGKPVTGIDGIGSIFSQKYLGQNLCRGNKGTVSLEMLRQKYQHVKSDIDESSGEFQQHVRAYILYVLGSFIFPEKTGGQVSTHYLSLMDNLDEIDTYAWGGAFLAHFYSSMQKQKLGDTSFGGQSFFLILFVLERVPCLLKILIDSNTIPEDFYPITFPLVIGWSAKLKSYLASSFRKRSFREHSLETYVTTLDVLEEENIEWRPYKRLSQTPLPRTALCRTSLVCFEKVALHQPDLAPRQLGVLSINKKNMYKLPPLKKRKVWSRTGNKGSDGLNWAERESHKRFLNSWKQRMDGIVAEFKAPIIYKRRKHRSKEQQVLKEQDAVNKDKEKEITTSVQDAPNSSGKEILQPSPKKKLLVLNINGILADIVDHKCHTLYSTFINKRAVLKRPHCDSFLQFCFEKFDVGVWSSRQMRNLDEIITHLFKDSRQKLLFIWDGSHCTDTRSKTIENAQKPILIKELQKLWEKTDPVLPWDKELTWEKGEYNETNTLLLDDTPYKALKNPAHTAIFPYSYSYKDVNDISLGPGGELRDYLDKLAAADNVKEYVQQHPYGQESITPSHRDWNFYSNIINSLRQA